MKPSNLFKMKKMLLLSIVLFLSSNIGTMAQDGPELTELGQRIQKQRVADNINFKESSPVFTLKAVRKLKDADLGINTHDSVGFKFKPGTHLRFYVACAGDPGNQAAVRLFSISGTTGKVLKEIKCESVEKNVLFFDFTTTDNNQMSLLLKLEKSTKAAAMARCIEFVPKGK
jgi:hypothetical protein